MKLSPPAPPTEPRRTSTLIILLTVIALLIGCAALAIKFGAGKSQRVINCYCGPDFAYRYITPHPGGTLTYGDW